MATNLELFNGAILESGVDLTELSSSAFDALSTSSDPLQRRFKRWIQQAWKEIQLERNEWEFTTKQAQLVIYPKLLVVNGNRSVAPPVNATYEGDTSVATFKVVSTELLSGSWSAGTATALVDFVELNGRFQWNEHFDELTPTITNLDVFRAKWHGRYNLQNQVSDLLEPNLGTFSIQFPAGVSVARDVQSTQVHPLTYVPWNQWIVAMENTQQYGLPQYFTTTPEGHYDFYPRPNGAYVLTFQYTAEPQTLTLAADVPTGLPAEYHDMIMWRAVMYYADYDSKPQVKQRAEARYEYYKNRVEKNQTPTIGFAFNRYAATRF